MNAAWIGVIGVLGGVVLGAGVNLVGDHFRWKREEERLERDSARALADRRRELCIDLATATDELFSRLHTFAELRSAKPAAWRSDDYAQRVVDAIEAVNTTLNRSYNELRIMGMRGRLLTTADRLIEISGGAVNGAFAEKKVEWWDSNEWGEASSEFLDAAHTEFRDGAKGRRAPVIRPHPPS